jgi:glutamate-1-semialdehyde 2,1-aminomutase
MLLEPVPGNMGVVLPGKGYLSALREICDAHGALLVLDEVMTGFRLAYGGAQEVYDIRADLTVLGKIIGGGLPVGAVAGPAVLMDKLSPLGPVYQAGTLSGNPLAMAAGHATLEQLRNGGAYGRLEALGETLTEGLKAAAGKAGLAGKVAINRAGSMSTVFFRPPPVIDYATATASNTRAFAAFFHGMLAGGVYLPPAQFEAWFISLAHTDEEITTTAEVAEEAFAAAAKLM